MTRVWCALACVGGVIAAGCTAPDLRRGKAALEAGDPDAAEQDLRPLADLGFDDAKMQLARVYAKREDPESLQEAILLYRELLERDPTVAVPLARTLMADGNEQALNQAQEMLLAAERKGDERAAVPLLELYSDYPARDPKGRAPALAERVAKLNTPDAETAVIKWYRRNSLTDERYKKELIKRCVPAKDRLPECYVDLARHYRSAGADKPLRELCSAALNRFTTGALPAPILERLGWSLVSEDIPGRQLPEAAYPMLKQAAQNSSISTVRLARLLIEYPHLDPEAQPEKLLLKAAGQGNPDAQLALGRLYLDGKLTAADPARAEQYLKQAAPNQPAAHYFLGRMYKRGYLGRADPVRAAQHYLTAARSGYLRADQALAQLFSDNRGVRPNLANAFVFASLAAEHDLPEGAAILQQLRATMKPAQIQEGERLLRQEIAVRSALPAATGTAVPPPQPPRAEVSP